MGVAALFCISFPVVNQTSVNTQVVAMDGEVWWPWLAALAVGVVVVWALWPRRRKNLQGKVPRKEILTLKCCTDLLDHRRSKWDRETDVLASRDGG